MKLLSKGTGEGNTCEVSGGLLCCAFEKGLLISSQGKMTG